MTEKNKTLITLAAAVIILGLVWLLVSLASGTSTPGNNATSTATSTASTTVNATSSTKSDVAMMPKNAVAIGGYANGTYTGYIRSMSKTNAGYTFTVDFVEYLTGKEAFLAAAAVAGTNPQYNWDMMHDRYQTYTQLAAGIRKLTNTEFEALYYSYQSKLGDNKSGILTAFPDGFVYIKNSSTAVRVIPGDKQLGSATVSNGSTQIAMDDLYLICRTPTPAVLDAYYRKYNAGVTCENPVQFTISKGKVTGVKVVYRP